MLLLFVSAASFAALLLLATACKNDDPCKETNCQNGGVCLDGTCDCPDGFSGPNCEVKDLCHEANITGEWGYDLFGGPSCWSMVCGHDGCLGSKQSPVNIVNPVIATDLPLLELSQLEPTPTKIIHNGHTIEFEQEPGTYLTYGSTANGLNEEYTLGQFHFHVKSEHQLGGNNTPLEAHLVCRNVWRNEYIVLGVMIEEGASNPFLAQFVNNLPKSEGQVYTDEALEYNAFDLLPANKSYFTYTGSLTTPPCSEVVKWIVMENKVQATKAEIDAFTTILKNNARPVQPLNGRVIKRVVL